MLLPKKDRLAVYSHLFKEGVIVAKKDTTKPKHDAIEVPNLHVMFLMRSLKSRGYVRETFCWQWFYWYLTEEGITYLREYLHLPDEIVPQTHKKQQVPTARPSGRSGEGYRKDLGAGRDFQPRFQGERGGFGRGNGGEGGYRREGGFGRGN